MPRSTNEQLTGAMLRAPLSTKAQSASNQWAGLTTILSGVATGVVSTTIVNSDSIISMTPRGLTSVLSGQGRAFEVKSISPGNSFVFGTQDGVAVSQDRTMMWIIFRTS